ncbi:F-box only protein 33 [Cephus cinctus]|uniref:F-box only protein 33 n=1 Tax=Cephus cinctus TaxID=211228 RepID=A0AAJ7BRA8_CEPCN|nr:F-box only protein 33 [Cephus cinctus]
MVGGECITDGLRCIEKTTNRTEESVNDAAEELEASMRKCEGHLSSTKTNSCSSCKGVNRTTEMAQEDNSPCWDSLPSVILFEIFSYLPQENRIRASQVCRNWRYALFHPSFWKKITFRFREDDNMSGVRFMTNCFGLSVREATVRCDIVNRCLKEASRLLKKLGGNTYLRKLFLEPSSCTLYWPTLRVDCTKKDRYFCTHIMESLHKIVENSNCLEALSFGCLEDLTASAGPIMESLQRHHAKHLTHLSLASVKDDPGDYVLSDLDSCMFRSFVRLSYLTVDYDYVSNSLLEALDSGLMERLVIHVHGYEEDHPGTTNNSWINFVGKNPHCELRLNLMHSYLAVTILDSHILQPAMPLTHLKVLFCETVNANAIHRLAAWYPNTLRSLVWIDCLDSAPYSPVTYDPNDIDSPDPLVLLAWKCTKLVEIVFLGYKYYQENLLAIARLREGTLERLEFAENDISSENETFWFEGPAIRNEIQEIMGGAWNLLTDAELPTVLMDPHEGDSREVIMPMVLRDQK